MRRTLIAMTALTCAVIILLAAIADPRVITPAGSSVTDAANASALSKPVSEAIDAFPTKDTPLPEEYVKWDGTIPGEKDPETNLYSGVYTVGNGTMEDPFEISTPGQFAFLLHAISNSLRYAYENDQPAYADACYVITQDLVFNVFEDDFDILQLDTMTVNEAKEMGINALACATASTSFSGVIDGGGHKLYHIYAPKGVGGGDREKSAGTGLFSEVQGVIMDLHLVGGFMKGAGDSGGTIASALTGTSKRTASLTGCSSSMTYVFEGGNCGGLVGKVSHATQTEIGMISDCCYRGDLIVHGAGGTRVTGIGGILGSYTPYKEGDKVYAAVLQLSRCVNYGSITTNGQRVGGIVGTITGQHNAYAPGFRFTECVNYGDITIDYAGEISGSAYARVGGILGIVVNHERDKGTRELSYCANFGKITVREQGVGGLIGCLHFASSSSSVPLTIQYCQQLGDIVGGTVEASGRLGGNMIGGVIGEISCPVEITDSVIGGTIIGRDKIGGVVGWAHSGGGYTAVRLLSVHLTTKIEAEGFEYGVGGVVGHFSCGSKQAASEITMRACFMDGSIKAKNRVGGVIGMVDRDGGSEVTLALSNTIIRYPVTYSSTAGGAGVLVGFLNGGALAKLTEKELYADTTLYNATSGTPVIRENPLLIPQYNNPLATSFNEDELTNGNYVKVLEEGRRNSISAASAAWTTSSKTSLPIHLRVDQMQGASLSHEYDGKSSAITHPEWMDAVPLCLWEEWNDTTETWDALHAAPSDAGKYRVRATLLYARAFGGTILEFEISRKTVNVANFAWNIPSQFIKPDGTTDILFEYSGEEFAIELADVPVGIKVEYEKDEVPDGIGRVTLSRGINAGLYRSAVKKIEDGSGNYILLNETSFPAPVNWEIGRTVLDFGKIFWSVSGQPIVQTSGTAYKQEQITLTYNGETQYIRLVELQYTDENGNPAGGRDLEKLLGIKPEDYPTISIDPETGKEDPKDKNTATAMNVGSYSASIDLKGRFSETNVNPQNMNVADTNYLFHWKIVPRQIDVWADIQFEGGTEVSGTYPGVEVTYDAQGHSLTYKEGSLPKDVTVTIVPHPDEESADGIFTDYRENSYAYIVTVSLAEDDKNNLFLIPNPDNPDVYIESDSMTLTNTRYLTINRLTPVIDGLQNMVEDLAPDYALGQPYAVGVRYTPELKMELDEEGNLIYTLALREYKNNPEINKILHTNSAISCFRVEYVRLVEKVVNGEKVTIEIPVTTPDGSLTDSDGQPARPYNAGTYKAYVTYTPDETIHKSSNLTSASATVYLSIDPIYYNLPLGVGMQDREDVVDGSEKMLTLSGAHLLPEFITPVYLCSNDTFPTEAGRYKFTVNYVFTDDMAGNYYPIRSTSATLTLRTETLSVTLGAGETSLGETISMAFGGNGTTYRMLAEERTDVEEFNTEWQVGYNTGLKKLWRIELKDGTKDVWRMDEALSLTLPLPEELRDKRRIEVVHVTIDEKGRFDMEVLEDVRPSMDGKSLIVRNPSKPGYYGIVTNDGWNNTFFGGIAWMTFAVCLIPPAALLLNVAVISFVIRSIVKRKKRNDIQA